MNLKIIGRLHMIICLLGAFILLISANADAHKQDTLKTSSNLFIELPLRFTFLQEKSTMLSGVRLGKQINPRISIALSVYHSFYLKSSWPTAEFSALSKNPRLFINSVGAELGFKLHERKHLSVWGHTLLGWGFMKYDLDHDNFRSSAVHYLAVEPSVTCYYKFARAASVGIGIGYRPLPGKKHFHFSANQAEGIWPVNQSLPNGINTLLILRGEL